MFTRALLSAAVLLMFADDVEMQTVPAAFVARKVAIGSYKLKIEERVVVCPLDGLDEVFFGSSAKPI